MSRNTVLPISEGRTNPEHSGGLIVRRQHADDRRATLVSLTARGTQASAAWTKGYKKLASMLFGDVDSRELRSFVQTLDHVRRRLREVPPPA
jgi:DNA-binding MarR family transcriptional regulator